MTKRCSCCKQFKDLSTFGVHTKTRDGLTNACLPCKRGQEKARYKLNADKKKMSVKKYYEENKEECLNRRAIYVSKNKDLLSEKQKRYYLENKDKYDVWRSERRARKLHATVKYDKEFTDFVVLEASKLKQQRKDITGIDWHLDHIIPLQGKRVCGLHVWNNLRVITARENLQKGNKV